MRQIASYIWSEMPCSFQKSMNILNHTNFKISAWNTRSIGSFSCFVDVHGCAMFVRKYCYGTRGGGFVDMCCFYRKNGWRRKRCAFWIVVWNHNFPCCYIFWWRNIHLSQLVQSQARITATKSMSPTSTLFYFCSISTCPTCTTKTLQSCGMWDRKFVPQTKP